VSCIIDDALASVLMYKLVEFVWLVGVKSNGVYCLIEIFLHASCLLVMTDCQDTIYSLRILWINTRLGMFHILFVHTLLMCSQIFYSKQSVDSNKLNFIILSSLVVPLALQR
jgi:hypothetical protein